MAKLMNQTKNLLICSDLETADSFWKRMKGLLGRSEMKETEGLWIKSCSSIHTYFMKFPIDVAFVDKNLKVTKISQSVTPGRLLFSTIGSRHVFEFGSGRLNNNNLEVGDQLNVDH